MLMTAKQAEAIRALNSLRRNGVRRVFVILPGARKVMARIFPASLVARAALCGEAWALCVLSGYCVHHEGRVVSINHPQTNSLRKGPS